MSDRIILTLQPSEIDIFDAAVEALLKSLHDVLKRLVLSGDADRSPSASGIFAAEPVSLERFNLIA